MTDTKTTATPVPAQAQTYQQHRLLETLAIAGGIALIAFIADFVGKIGGVSAFAPPLAASLFLMIALPESAMSQPRAVVGGQLVCAILSLIVVQYCPVPLLIVPVAFFIAVAAMILLRVIHAPAAATIYLVASAHHDWMMVATPFVSGLAVILPLAMMVNKLRGHKYPRHWM